MPVSVIGLFCEDIREERSGQETLIGIFADNLIIPDAPMPVLLPRLAVYIRVHIAVSELHLSFKPRLVIPGRQDLMLAPMDAKMIQTAQEEARANSGVVTGLIARAVMAPFQIFSYGRINAVVNVDGEDHIAGTLNILQQQPST